MRRTTPSAEFDSEKISSRPLGGRKVNRTLLPIAALALMAASAGCAADSDDQSDGDAVSMEKVTFVMSVRVPNPASAPFSTIPFVMGYYEDEGLDVELLFTEGSGEAITAISAGKALAGDAGTPALAAAVAQGQDVIGFAASIPGNPYPVTAPVDSDIRTLRDFENKTVGIQAPASSSAQIFKGLMTLAEVDMDSIKMPVVGAGPAAAAALEAGKIDAYMGWDAAYADLAGLGHPQRIIDDELDADLGYLAAYAATTKSVETRGDTLIKLGRAIAKSKVFAAANPEATVRMGWEMYPESRPAGMDEDKALAAGVTTLKARLENLFTVDDLHNNVEDSTVEALITVLERAEIVEEGAVSAEDIWTSEFVEAMNDFDVAEIEAEAKAYKAP